MLSKGIVDASFDGVEDVSSMALTKRSIGLNARCGDDAQQMCLLPTLAVIWIRAEVPRVKAPKTRLPRDTRLDTDCTLGGNHNNHNTRTAMALLVDKHRPRSLDALSYHPELSDRLKALVRLTKCAPAASWIYSANGFCEPGGQR